MRQKKARSDGKVLGTSESRIRTGRIEGVSNSCREFHSRQLAVQTQKTDTRGLQKLLINTDDEYTKPQTEQRILEQRREESIVVGSCYEDALC